MLPKPTHEKESLTVRKLHTSKGFALVATLSILSLTVIIALAMLSLAETSLKSSGHNGAMEKAKANAKMALAQAISELQRLSGADTRITAPADILVSGAPALTGVWKSWEGTNHDDMGRPVTPDYGVKSLPSSNASSRFLGFLVSGASNAEDPIAADLSNLVSSTASNSTVALLSTGSLGSNVGQVHVPPQMFEGGSGGYAWWVSPENQKARLMQPYLPQSDDAVGWAGLAKSHSVPDTGEFGLNAYNSNKEDFVPNTTGPSKPIAKVVSRDTMSLLGSTNATGPNLNFHDYSPNAVGLLTNSATGGWRKDLSILSEKWNDIYEVSRYVDNGIPYSTRSSVELPLFRYAPEANETSTVGLPLRESYDLDQSSLYPWNDYQVIGDAKYPVTYHAASASWQSLVNFATYYKKLTFNSSFNKHEGPFGWNTSITHHRGGTPPNRNFYRYYHGVELNPIVARVQLVVQVQAIPDPNPNNTTPEESYRVNLRCVPVVTLWNPYNVAIDKKLKGATYVKHVDKDFGIGTQRSLPITMSIINGTVPPAGGFTGRYRLLNGGNSLTVDGKLAGENFNHLYDYNITQNKAADRKYTGRFFGDLRAVTAWLPIEFNLQPGEAKVFTPAFNRFGAWSAGARLKEGYAAGDDAGLSVVEPDLIDPNNWHSYKHLHRVPTSGPYKLLPAHQLRFSLKSDRYTKIYSNTISKEPGGGTFFSVGTAHWPVNDQAGIDNGEVPKGTSYLRSVMAVNPHMDWNELYWPNDDLAEIQYNVSEISPGNGNPDWTNIFSISVGPRLTIGAGAGNPANRPTKGMVQNSPFALNSLSLPQKEARYHPGNNPFEMSYSTMSLNSDLSPEVGNAGYIATGFQSGEGLSNMVMSEFPLTPIASLAELQSWNVRGGNPLPPFQHNLIGNSDATPLIRKNDILPNALLTADVEKNLQHDDAYCSNHLLFDDWFFSSIAPKPTDFGGTISKTIDVVYKDFLEGTGKLVNRAYRPIREDRGLTSAQVAARVDEMVNNVDENGFLKIASRLEVDGMFNVNSTSVKAWRALLGHSRGKRVAYHTSNGIEVDPNTYDHVVSRNSIASDVKAGVASGAGASFDNGSEYSGFKTFSNEQLDELAQNIVDQVRLRGPFLSLSEFINRQLSTDEDLAIAGALQAALDSLTDDPNAVLKDVANQLSEETMDVSDPKIADVGYAFNRAAEGYTTHGFPGWIRQADILRPLAPVLSARDDTFTIRAYGDARDTDGKIIARAWCEATIQRSRDFVNKREDEADSIEPPVDALNLEFGRKYKMISFTWLKASEV